jgi:deoxyribose-phosphate aldolase
MDDPMYANLSASGVPTAASPFAARMMTAVFSPAATEEEARAFLRRFGGLPPIDAIFVDQPWVELAKEILDPLGIGVGVEAAYPVGNTSTAGKIAAIEEGIRRGAVEIDVGGHFAAIVSGDYAAVADDARAMVAAAGDRIRLMVLPETAILMNDQKLRTLDAYAEAGVRGIKTSSGYGWNTHLEDVRLIRRRFADAFQIDVSGGVRSFQDAIAYFGAGADKIHASPIFRILDEARKELP